MRKLLLMTALAIPAVLLTPTAADARHRGCGYGFGHGGCGIGFGFGHGGCGYRSCGFGLGSCGFRGYCGYGLGYCGYRSYCGLGGYCSPCYSYGYCSPGWAYSYASPTYYYSPPVYWSPIVPLYYNSYTPYFPPTYYNAYPYVPNVVTPAAPAVPPVYSATPATVVTHYTPKANPAPAAPAAPAAAGNRANVVVTLPAEARLTANGVALRSTTERRVFATPVLEPGKLYTYTFKMEVVQDGQAVELTKQVQVRAGEDYQVAFTMPAVKPAVTAQR